MIGERVLTTGFSLNPAIERLMKKSLDDASAVVRAKIEECEALGGHVQLWDSNWHWRCLWCAYHEDVPGGAVGGVKPL